MTKTTVLHCSDLHFGKGFQPQIAEKLLASIERIQPQAVVVSGDLTMRARAYQFAAARRFFQKIRVPLLLIPGNHDVPLYNLFVRISAPFGNYTRYTEGLSTNPIVLDRVGIFGINSVNPKRHQKGHFTRDHLHAVTRWLADLPEQSWRVVVTHQHFVAIPGFYRPGSIHDAEKVLNELEGGGVHAILCGHMHFKYVGSTRDFFPNVSRPIALVHAGTATSGRLRASEQLRHSNNFMLLDFYDNQFDVTPHDWTPESDDFHPLEKTTFTREFFQI